MKPLDRLDSLVATVTEKWLVEVKTWLEPWFMLRGDKGRIDSTENVGEEWGVHSIEPDGDFETSGFILTANGNGGSEWRENTIGAAYETLVLSEPTLFAYWPLTDASGDATDLGPHDQDLPPNGSPTYGVDGPFPPSTAVNFGNNSNFQKSIVGALSDLIFGGTNPFTIEAIAYMPSNADSNDWLFGVNEGTAFSVALGLSSAYGTNAVGISRGDAGGTAGTGAGAGTSIPTQRWTHLAFTYDGSNQKLYVDGTLTQTIADTNDTGTRGTSLFQIGAFGYPSQTQSKAYASNVALYTTNLSQGTIRSHAAVFARGGEGGALNIDHGGLYGLSDDDHPQYVLRSILTTIGDLFVATTSGVVARLANGSAGQVLEADPSGSAPKVKWATRIKTICKSGSTALTGDVTLSPGSNVTLTQVGNDIEIAATGSGGSGVDSIEAEGGGQLTGDVTFSEGANVTLTTSGNDIEIAASSGGTVEHDYAEFTTGVTISATTEATANSVVSAGSVSFDGSTRVCIEFFSPGVVVQSGALIVIVLYDGSSSIGRMGIFQNSGSGQSEDPVLLRRFMTPSNASHTYSVRAYRITTNGTVVGDVGGVGFPMPGYIRITTA